MFELATIAHAMSGFVMQQKKIAIVSNMFSPGGLRPPLAGWVLSGLCLLALLGVSGLADDKPALSFEDDVVPILQVRCLKCHGDEARKGGLDLRRKFTMLKGGDGGAAIVPGKPEESLLLEMIESKEMPPKEEDPLDAKQIDVLRRWITAGAPIKGKDEPPLEATDAVSQISEEDRDFWSFRPPVRPAVPTVKDAARVRNPIDAFVLAKLEEKGLSFNPDASRTVLLRRVCFDLTGLPPTPAQLEAFLADDRADAYERLVDTLLESSHYGERWARHWLDIAGYADSDGFLEADRERPEAWRYRDYVVRALNSDKPYDQFVREQIAGDELSDWRRAEELTPEMIEQLTATGFLRTAADPTYVGYKEKPEIYKVLADTVQIVGSTFLGVTVQCARCHEHKSEPIAQGDYYSLQAILKPSYDPDRWLASGERTIPLATDAQWDRLTKHNNAVTERVKALNGEVTEVVARFRDKYLAEKLADVPADVKEKVKAALLVAENKRNDEQKELVKTHAAGVTPDETTLFAAYAELKSDVEKLRAAIAAETALVKTVPQLRALADLDDKPPPTNVLRRGDFQNKGRVVEPDVPRVFVEASFQFEPKPAYKSTGRRRAFAEWLADPRHPTTARLQVNRLWAHHFGRGLVETVDDFGHTGKAPSHPELLDWLATEFTARGWSQKAMHRLIVTSTAYRQSAAFDAAKATADSDNVLLWTHRPRRHDGESLRDAILAVSGKLNPQMFGPPVPVSRQQDGSVVTADGPGGNRRSLYLQVRRSQPVTLLESFDTPKMEVNCTRRTEAIVATQALTLLNSPFMENSAKALTERITAGADDRAGRVALAWRLLFTRDPTESERRAVDGFLDGYVMLELGEKSAAATVEEKQTAEAAAWPHLALTLLNSNEFLFVD
jgi:hypothetical protein